MSLIEWQEEFDIGIASVDAEHRELVALINDVHALLDENAKKDAVLSMLGEIYARIAAHFALEERHMRESRYPDYEAHKTDHESLLDDLRDIMDSVADDGSYDDARLSTDLELWFTVHFKTHDAKLHRHFEPDSPARH